MELENALYYYGIQAKLPYSLLKGVAEAGDLTRQPLDVWRRSQVARRMRRNSKWRGFMPREKGYAIFDKSSMPGVERVVAVCRKLVEERRDNGPKRREKNPFTFYERPEDFENNPELLDFALSDPIIETVSDYLGFLPQLKSIGLWLTQPLPKDLFGSQLMHLDQPEVGIVGVFINVSDVRPENGPFSFLPADLSRRVNDAVNYPKRYYCDDGRVTDEEVFSVCRPEDVKSLVGPAGTGGFVDLSACQHYGSRCSSGERIIFAIKFQKAHKARHEVRPFFRRYQDKVEQPRSLVIT
ncbi:MAG TPA: hypothetical protein VFB31_17925 [Pseudolabrys sp.]|nr:hypothetical protein [Pseudolabrys sp.]